MRQKKNETIHATVVKSADKPKERDVLDRADLLGVSAEVAQDTLCNRNWPWKNARSHFPLDPLMRTVDKFYPNAKGGPLYVDEPETEGDAKRYEKKRAVMKVEGLRYIVVTRDMTAVDARKQLTG